jgi:anti-sigma-K factor RskA
MSGHGACPHRDDAGPWVLSALTEDNARAFAAHLETCPECRDEVAALQPVADVLPMAAPQAVPPPELKARIMAVVEAEASLLRAAGPEADRPPRARAPRRRRAWLGRLRPVPATVLATALLALGVAGGVLVSGGSDDVTTHPGFGPRGTQVALRVDGDHGQLDLHGMPGAPAGRVYQVWLVTGQDRPRATHALFSVPADGRARVDIPDSLKGTDQVLVTAEPPGGSTAPTSAPVAGAKLS